ncbi:MAG: hypothetical protein A6D92_03885 [Symbiobacterium thermophilum]|uniref:Uncharacterized protein n=1 Tax=Symbiobacterium thermophilum TaxID=2734 RepID=A0A1Y2T5Q8_SYMTR|nr:MAG: hypothetical protein A6D92_03885 [Symbiobacterium thermophilum]
MELEEAEILRSAGAQRAQGQVAHLARGVAGAAEEVAADQDAGADAFAHVHQGQVGHAHAGPLEVLAQGHEVHVVLHHDRHPETLPQPVTEGHLLPPAQRGGVADGTLGVGNARHSHRHRGQPGGLYAGPVDEPLQEVAHGPGRGVGVGGEHAFRLHLESAAEVGQPAPEPLALEAGGEDEAGRRVEEQHDRGASAGGLTQALLLHQAQVQQVADDGRHRRLTQPGQGSSSTREIGPRSRMAESTACRFSCFMSRALAGLGTATPPMHPNLLNSLKKVCG